MLDPWWWTENLSKTCRVLFQNKFEKLVHLVGFIISIYYDVRSSECQKKVLREIWNCWKGTYSSGLVLEGFVLNYVISFIDLSVSCYSFQFNLFFNSNSIIGINTNLFLDIKNLGFLLFMFCYLEVTYIWISFFETFPIPRRQSNYISPYRLFLLLASY